MEWVKIKEINLQNCTGCRACEHICPQHCISMTPNEDGFLYPEIDQEKCVKCGLCDRRCPIHLTFNNDLQQPKVYATYLRDQEKLMQSSSGGAFFAIASYVLENGGVVFGCAFNQNLEAVHICIRDAKGLSRLHGSKYVQSDTLDTFSQAKEYLEKGIPVLYTGTPCQIAGLKAFLTKDYAHLITVDLICHGVPSPIFFKRYISWLEQKIHGKVVSYQFRDKTKCGGSHSGKILYKRRENFISKNISPTLDPYYSLFLKGDNHRPCCYNCKYASPNREGDFTIGDYWGIEQIHPELPTQQGISLLMVNSCKAFNLMPKISTSLKLVETTLEQAAAQNHQLTHPTPKSEKRDALMSAMRKGDFEQVVVLWHRYYRKEILLAQIKSMIPPKIKATIKRFVKSFK
jgi:coenzyme F420-reducing hydrogenase beta subunit